MISTSSFDFVDTTKQKVEIHQSFISRKTNNDTASRSSSPNDFVTPDIATTLKSEDLLKVENLYKRKQDLLNERSSLLNSFLFRLFNFGIHKIQTIDRELNSIEEETHPIERKQFKSEIKAAKKLLTTINKNISVYKSEIEQQKHNGINKTNTDTPI